MQCFDNKPSLPGCIFYKFDHSKFSHFACLEDTRTDLNCGKYNERRTRGSWDMHWDACQAWHGLKGKMLNQLSTKLGTYGTTSNLPFNFLFTYDYVLLITQVVYTYRYHVTSTKSSTDERLIFCKKVASTKMGKVWELRIFLATQAGS